MTPKEKAQELVERFKKYAHSNPSHESELFYRILKENAKECALIAVDEIIKSVSHVVWENEKNINFACFFNYWQEVKQEIEKL